MKTYFKIEIIGQIENSSIIENNFIEEVHYKITAWDENKNPKPFYRRIASRVFDFVLTEMYKKEIRGAMERALLKNKEQKK